MRSEKHRDAHLREAQGRIHFEVNLMLTEDPICSVPLVMSLGVLKEMIHTFRFPLSPNSLIGLLDVRLQSGLDIANELTVLLKHSWRGLEYNRY